MTIHGYARVSTGKNEKTSKQTLKPQIDALKEAGVEKIWEEYASGSKNDRPVRAKLLAALKNGDTLVVWKMDRFGRSLVDVATTVDALHENGIEFRSLTEQIDTSTPQGRLTRNLLAAFGEFERELIRERVQSGLKAAKARGRVGGRKRKIQESSKKAILRLREEGISVGEIAKQFGVSRPTIYGVFAEARDKELYGEMERMGK